MDEGSLEQVVVDFSEGHFDALVCTTIIERHRHRPPSTRSSSSVPTCSASARCTSSAGVWGAAASALVAVVHPRDRTLTEEAYERLRTIGESTDLGSGFKIAMRDLEIRGVELLGQAQSGHIAAVGYDLDRQMVTEAVAEMKGEEGA